MKSMLFVGATLMVGACIYGFVDFRKANQRAEFRSLYKKEEKKQDLRSADKRFSTVVVDEKHQTKQVTDEAKVEQVPTEELKDVKTTAAPRRRLSRKAFSRGEIREFVPPVVEADTKAAREN